MEIILLSIGKKTGILISVRFKIFIKMIECDSKNAGRMNK